MSILGYRNTKHYIGNSGVIEITEDIIGDHQDEFMYRITQKDVVVDLARAQAEWLVVELHRMLETADFDD